MNLVSYLSLRGCGGRSPYIFSRIFDFLPRLRESRWMSAPSPIFWAVGCAR